MQMFMRQTKRWFDGSAIAMAELSKHEPEMSAKKMMQLPIILFDHNHQPLL
jgi:hypothetical protein